MEDYIKSLIEQVEKMNFDEHSQNVRDKIEQLIIKNGNNDQYLQVVGMQKIRKDKYEGLLENDEQLNTIKQKLKTLKKNAK